MGIFPPVIDDLSKNQHQSNTPAHAQSNCCKLQIAAVLQHSINMGYTDCRLDLADLHVHQMPPHTSCHHAWAVPQPTVILLQLYTNVEDVCELD